MLIAIKQQVRGGKSLAAARWVQERLAYGPVYNGAGERIVAVVLPVGEPEPARLLPTSDAV
jgi:hypothetical protein